MNTSGIINYKILININPCLDHDKSKRLTLKESGIKDEATLEKIVKTIRKEASKMVLKSKDFGIPQNRQRIYIVLWRKELNYNFQYPLPPATKVIVGDILEENPLIKYTISDKLCQGDDVVPIGTG